MDQDDRDSRDAAGVGPYARQLDQLVALSTLDSWRVAEGEPDIRGWEVQTVSNRQLGTVSDLMIDAAAGEVVLIDVDLPGSDKHTFVPIRVVQIDRARRVILMDSADVPGADSGRGAKADERVGTPHRGQRDRALSAHRSRSAGPAIADRRYLRGPRGAHLARRRLGLVERRTPSHRATSHPSNRQRHLKRCASVHTACVTAPAVLRGTRRAWCSTRTGRVFASS